MSELEAILFDVDGTLADTEEVHRSAFNEAFKEEDLDWHWSRDLYAALLAVTGGKERILHFIRQHNPAGDLPEDLDGFIAGLHAEKTRHYVAQIEAGAVQLRPGVKRLLTEAHDNGVRLAIATTTTLVNVESLISHSFAPEVMSWFEVVGAGNVVGEKKPAPDIYHYVMKELNLTPGQCIAIEDSANGLRSAMAAGLKTIITCNHYTQHDSFEGALCVLDSMGEPGQPFTLLQGDVLPEGLPGKGFLDLELTRALHRRA